MMHEIEQGLAFAAEHEYERAAEQFRTVIEKYPENVAGHLNLGAILWQQRNLQGAAHALSKAVALNPLLPEAHVNLAVIYAEHEQFEAAILHLQNALRLAPTAQGFHNMGVIRRRLGERQAALEAFDESLKLEADWLTMLNRANELLVLGQFRAGWQAYEARLQAPTHTRLDHHRWQGDPVQHLLLHYEQGFGDTIQSLRYVEAVSQRCQRLSLVVHPSMIRLSQFSFQHLINVEITDHCPESYDCYEWLDSLPGRFDAGDSVIPNDPYIIVPRSLDWQQRFADLSGLKIGVVWAGRAEGANDARRSMRLSELDRLLSVPNVHFISLQCDRDEHDDRLLDVSGHLTDWAETAAAIVELDVVISVDTAVAHLAGAMGKPVWLMNRFDTCWRWLLQRSDTAWYPSMTIFRQRYAGDWKFIVDQMIDRRFKTFY